MKWIITIILTVVSYFILQSIDDNKARKEFRDTAPMSKRILLFFFLLIMYLVIVFYFNLGSLFEFKNKKDNLSLGGRKFEEEMEKNMLNNIHEEIETGIPPFK